MTENTTSNSLQIIYCEQDIHDGAKAFGSGLKNLVNKTGVLDTSHFKTQIAQFCDQISNTLNDLHPSNSDFKVDSFEVTVDITAKGEVRLVGSIGTELKGGVKIVFKR